MNASPTLQPQTIVAGTRIELGQRAAHDVAEEMRSRLKLQRGVRMIFAAAPSQGEMLASLIGEPDIDWRRVTAFHMDEYLDLPAAASQRFGNWLRERLFSRLPFAQAHLLDPAENPVQAAAQYARLLHEAPIDIVCLGIGVNGHLAFNDPPADLNDPEDVKIVALDETCRKQQVEDGTFGYIGEVPRRAITLTIPRLLRADRLYCCVPGSAKREAVRRALHDPIGPACPATALRLHPACRLYLDKDSAP